MSSLDDWPVAVSVHDDKVMMTCMLKEVGADALEWVLGLNWGCGWSIGLGGGYAVAMLLSLT